ncbi:hypothetical protein [Nonlabens xiamenensis]|uniref:hypothetical protein n=1 Tax=Nonlabens xiamenensis TaxID=2341043 RepID=UPI001F0C9B2C|nr:hypothetical protein [Nonlabens xiamenensis]
MEHIKKELVLRVEQLVSYQRKQKADHLGNTSAPRTWSDKIAETEELVQRVYHTLYDILQQQGVCFGNHREVEGFVSLMEPTLHDLVIRNMDD